MKRTLLVLAAALAAVPSNGMATEPTARDHFYEAALQTGNEEPAWRAVRTSFLLRRDRKDQDPIFREVSEQARFQSGDSFRLRVESNMDGYIYLFLRDSAGDLKLLFPYDSAGHSKAGASNKVAAFESRMVPAKSWFRMDGTTGTEQVFLFVSPQPVPELERMKKGASAAKLEDLEQLISANGKPDSLRFDEADLTDASDLGATFYAERRTAQRHFLVRRIELEHKAK